MKLHKMKMPFSIVANLDFAQRTHLEIVLGRAFPSGWKTIYDQDTETMIYQDIASVY